jgi:hypothetical protein
MRKCGECTLCCKLIAVRELGKEAGQRCDHQRHGKGCSIYPRRPPSCVFWNCRWLVEDDTADLSRPDRSHYVIDVMPDFITATPNDGGEKMHVQVIQVWVDPKYPDAHQDPPLRAYLARRGEEGIAAIIRYSGTDGFILAPPAMNKGEWCEIRNTTMRDETHTLAEIEAALGGKVKIEVRE